MKNEYSGRILIGNFSQELKSTVHKHITACKTFDRIGMTVMPYIAAWQVDHPGIWYEFVSNRLLDLFGVTADKLSDAFYQSILDRREYELVEVCPDIREMVLPRNELESQRHRLRDQSIESGMTEAVYKVRLPDSRIRWLKDCATITTYTKDKICLSPGYLTDVSMEISQKDQVDELNVIVNRDKGLLVEAERHAALGQLSAKVFHEIRNPVLSIGGLAKRLSEQQPGDETHKYMTVIVNEARRLEAILNNLFKFTSQVKPELNPTDPIQMVKSVISILRSDLEQSKIRVSFHSPAFLPDIKVDEQLMHEALVHIIKNSIEEMINGGRLTIELGREKDAVSIIITDSGTGIATTHEKRLTEPFFTTKVYGSGLGLSIAQKAVQIHGGKLVFKSLDSGGTQAHILLPQNLEQK